MNARAGGRAVDNIVQRGIDRLIVIGGDCEGSRSGGIVIPTICLPAAMDNNLQFSDILGGADNSLKRDRRLH